MEDLWETTEKSFLKGKEVNPSYPGTRQVRLVGTGFQTIS